MHEFDYLWKGIYDAIGYLAKSMGIQAKVERKGRQWVIIKY